MVMQKNNIQHIYIGINTIFVENGVVMIESITYVKPYEDKKIMGILNVHLCKFQLGGARKSRK
jgi:hypothetical protein